MVAAEAKLYNNKLDEWKKSKACANARLGIDNKRSFWDTCEKSSGNNLRQNEFNRRFVNTRS